MRDSVFGYGDPSRLPPTADQQQRQNEQIRRNLQLAFAQMEPLKTIEQLAEEPPEVCAKCGEIEEAHRFDGRHLRCPLRVLVV